MAALILAVGAAVLAAAPPASGAEGLCFGMEATVFDDDGDGLYSGTKGSDVMIGTDDAESFIGMGGDDYICAGSGNDGIVIVDGAAKVDAGAGNDTVHITGSDPDIATVDGGPGSLDTVTFAQSAAALDVFPVGRNSFQALLGQRTINAESVEVLVGTRRKDSLNALVRKIEGGDGNDRIVVRSGVTALGQGDNDTFVIRSADHARIRGGSGFNTMRFDERTFNRGVSVDLDEDGPGIEAPNRPFTPFSFVGDIERIIGTSFDDVIRGLATTELIRGGKGRDTLLFSRWVLVYDGGLGVDTLSFESLPGSARVDLGRRSSSYQDPISEKTYEAQVARVERVIGGNGSDILIGNGANNRLFGGPGNDRLFGRAGNDILRGQRGGNDKAFGGAGLDDCIAEYEESCEVTDGSLWVWNLDRIEPASGTVEIQTITGFLGELTEAGALELAYDNGRDEYALPGSFTVPPGQLVVGQTYDWTQSGTASVEAGGGDTGTPIRIALCHVARVLPVGTEDAGCFDYGVNLDDAPTSGSSTWTFSPPTPKSEGEELMVSLRTVFLAQIDFIYTAESFQP